MKGADSAGAATLPVFSPTLTEADAEAVAAAVLDGWISGSAPAVREFERAFAGWCGAGAGAACANGTAALELALMALGVGPGDKVLCPSLAIISCARAILAVGATPVLVDVDPDTWVLDVDRALAAVDGDTKAVLAVHLFGLPVDLAALHGQGLLVVEDAAQAIGSEVLVDGAWARCGSAGDLGTFSFYANKTLTTGEGGMVVGDDEAVIDRTRRAANLFFGRERRFVHEELGHNYRLSGIQAALGLAQIPRLDDAIRLKCALGARYRDALADVPEVRFQHVPDWARPVPWMTAIVADDVDASDLGRHLAAAGIETRPFFTGLHQQPALQAAGVDCGGDFPATERLANHGLYLPSTPSLSDAELARICDAIRAAVRP